VLLSGDQPTDRREIRLGFRKVEASGGKLLLNGQEIYLTGFNRHEDSRMRDGAVDLGTARRDLIEIKEAGANFVRLCHYPHHPGELDLCDELGLLVMDEIPLYWWDGMREGVDHHRRKLEASKRQIRKMIRRDINHPSVIFWSVSNENREERPEVAEGNRQLVRLAKELDPSRLAVHVSDHHWQSHPNFSCDDVICVNAYPSLHRHGYDGDYAYDLSDSTRFWRDGLHRLHTQYADKPILVSEFGYAALEGVYDGAFGEDIQADAIAHEFAGMAAPYVCGATVWCWADHPWPAATFEFCRHLGTSPYGVVSRDRRKLKAYRRIRQMFRARQGLAGQSRVSASVPGRGGYGLNMIRSSMADLPQVPFPDGFGIRPMRMDEGGLWLDIQRDAEPYLHISDGLFVQEFGYDLEAVQWRSFVVIDSRGVGVGTISAWYDRDFRGKDYGRIHWVAIRPAYQGKGLGRASLAFALNQLAQWHDRCCLGTQSRRHAAIRLYLDAGFVPDMESPGAIEGWREVKNALDHPALSAVDGL
jgi:GNAT superfamily N-acetyltransferase